MSEYGNAASSRRGISFWSVCFDGVRGGVFDDHIRLLVPSTGLTYYQGNGNLLP